MDVNKFLGSLDIFKVEDDEYIHAKTTTATVISLLLMFLPASALRWDGSIRTPLDRTPLSKEEEVRLYPNAALNRSIRILSVLIGLGLANYSAMLDFKDLTQAPLRRKKREAQEILQDEILNARIIELLPEEKQEDTKSALTPQQQALAALMGGKPTSTDTDEDLEAIAASKFKVSGAATAKNQQPFYSKANAELQQAMDASLQGNEQPGGKYHQFMVVGSRIIQDMIISDKSILIASGTGTGKTTTERYLLEQMHRQYPGITFYALLQKNDNLFGVERENMQIFQPQLIDQYLDQDEDEPFITLEAILRPLFTVYNIFLQRKDLPTAERERLRATAPVRCILGDWFGVHGELESRLSKKDYQRILSMLRQIITVGRDSGVGLIVDTQSANLSDLGLAESASIRQSLDIYAQGFVAEENKQQKGELKTMRLLFENPKICDKDERAQIMTAYQILREGVQRKEINSPLIFTTVGSNASIGIVPHLHFAGDEAMTDRRSLTIATQEDASAHEPDNLAAEFNRLVNKPQEEQILRHYLNIAEEDIVKRFLDPELTQEETEFCHKEGILLYIVNSAITYPITERNIQKSRAWRKYGYSDPSFDEVRKLAESLKETGWLYEPLQKCWALAPV